MATLVGPVKGMTNYWTACAVMADLAKAVALSAVCQLDHKWRPGFDVWAMDVSRFGDYATMQFTNARVRENYARRFSIRYPNEELQAEDHY